MTESARYSSSLTQTRNGRRAKSTRVASFSIMVAPKRSACSRNFCISSGPWMPIREARIVLDVGGDHQLAHRHVAGDHEGLEIGASGIDGGGQPRRPGADDDDPAVPSVRLLPLLGWPVSGGTVAVMQWSVYRNRASAPRSAEPGGPSDSTSGVGVEGPCHGLLERVPAALAIRVLAS